MALTLDKAFIVLLCALSILLSEQECAQAQTAAASSHNTGNAQSVTASPKSPWGDFTVVKSRAPRDPWYIQVLLWAPNRIMDLIDVFRVDLGLGPSYGGVVRLTRYGQMGYRVMSPASVRVGDFGRLPPFNVERSAESGMFSGFKSSREREICVGEVGAGLDVGIAGAYGGICVDELIDFIGGLVFLDFKHDDMR